MEEQECIRRCQSGDWTAFEPIFRSHIQMAVRTAYLITRDWAATEDAAQEALIRAYRSIGSFRAGSAFAPWLYRIVVNEARRLAARPRAVLVNPETLAELIPAARGDCHGAGFAGGSATLHDIALAVRKVVFTDRHIKVYFHLSKLRAPAEFGLTLEPVVVPNVFGVRDGQGPAKLAGPWRVTVPLH